LVGEGPFDLGAVAMDIAGQAVGPLMHGAQSGRRVSVGTGRRLEPRRSNGGDEDRAARFGALKQFAVVVVAVGQDAAAQRDRRINQGQRLHRLRFVER